MKRWILTLSAVFVSISFGQYFEGDMLKEFGFKTGLVRLKYDSVDLSEQSRSLEEFLSIYGYLASKTTMGFTAGLSLELATGNRVDSDRTAVYTSLELNPGIELEISERIRIFTGFGGSVNRFKEASVSLSNTDTNLGLQFFLGAKYKLSYNLGVLGEYKGKTFLTGDYDGDFVHHFNVGIFFLVY